VYHVSSQLISVAMLPFATIIMFFAPEILFAWTRNSAVAEHSALLVTLITGGAIINASLNIPYALQLAYGWVRLGFWMTLINVVVLAPLIYFAAVRYGATGAAAVWVGMNACNLIVGMHLLHRRILIHEKWRWAIRDFALPLATAMGIGAIARVFFPPGLAPIATVAALAGLALIIAIACALVAPAIRTYALKAVFELRSALKS
jgi:O-antigen/teichoic acid export membrane protein